MLLNLLAGADPTRNVPPSEAALYALLGFAVVFVGILFLIFIVWAVGQVMSKLQAKPSGTEKTETKPAPAMVLPAVDELSDETVAVIMAALTAYYQTNNPKCEFTVKRIKRI
ncbi:MAG: OadG family protein [Clostridia bacterium]|nr:OadG family protein [Clostridia bacterium]